MRSGQIPGKLLRRYALPVAILSPFLWVLYKSDARVGKSKGRATPLRHGSKLGPRAND